ncbi:MAG: N-6 DNA methylase [Bryobacterales bacterium]|nr:N-6 DNA methylase [Bryobacterales bacterium]
MSASPLSAYTTIRTEGALLPADILARIASGDTALGGLDPASYHLDPTEKLGEATNRAWNRLQARWATFQSERARLAPTDTGTSITRERWLLPLFEELKFGRLQLAAKIEIDGKSYAVSHSWQHVPFHLVGCQVDLDRRVGVAGAQRSSPHSLLQELLNRSSDRLWGIVSNGLRLRLLRDNISLTRQAYVEFDLEAMMAGEAYPDFVLLWLLLHQSRFEAERPEQCQLEKWSQAARTEGVRVLDGLRDGVQRAIEHLGQGFLAHPANVSLRESLRSGALDKQDYYRQILRLVYRLLFLFVADDRDLLLVPTADPAAQKRYRDFYATTRLRRLATTRAGSRHHDLYSGLKLVMDKLCGDGCPELALPALGSFLFSPRALPDLNGCDLSNLHLLETIRSLAVTQTGQSRRVVDYKNLGAEELGSVYESLLELHPDLDAEAATFELKIAAGSERKKTGSYYTPTSLISCLLDSTLDPVLDEAAKQAEPETAILKLKVVDPACGSGHFLIAAAHRIAKRLAGVRTGEEEPPPEAQRKALRDVIGHCIYGVDLNPMAVELCKVSLWMEALDPGKPLSFLEHRIQCGNSLLGATPALLARGIPDEAFTPIEGDDKEICKAFKRINKDERNKQMRLFAATTEPWQQLGNFAASLMNLDTVGDDSIEAIREKERMYEEAIRSGGYLDGCFWADTWCAAFVWKKTREFGYPITEEVFRRIEKNPHACEPWMRHEIQRLAKEYRFFHWHLAFPDVFKVALTGERAENPQTGWNAGFDVVLGNPPWDTLSPDAKEFFSNLDPQVRFLAPAEQEARIGELLQSPSVSAEWNTWCRYLYAVVLFIKQSGRYTLFAPGNLGKGDFNVYRMFVEAALRVASRNGRVGQVVPEGFYNGANCMAIRKWIFERCSLSKLVAFENAKEVWFDGIDSRTKFVVYALWNQGSTHEFPAAFNVRTPARLAAVNAGSTLSLPVSLVAEFSPDALAIMEFDSQFEIDVARKMYSRHPKFGDDTAGPPTRTYMREIDMGNDRDLFSDDPAGMPVYEGRMVGIFDHRAKGYSSGRGRAAEWIAFEFNDQRKSICPQWRIEVSRLPNKLRARVRRHRIGFCDVASPTNERSLVAALVPPETVCGDKVPTITFPDEFEWAHLLWLAVANSFSIDFIVRKKVSLKMSYTILDSLPFPRIPVPEDPAIRRIVELALRLTCTSAEMNSYWNLIAGLGAIASVQPIDAGALPPGLVLESERHLALAEIEVLVARSLYGLTREELSYILATFPIVRRKDEAAYGEYRTKRVILEIYDAMAEAERTGAPYQTRLDPPPADPRCCHPPQHEPKGASV